MVRAVADVDIPLTTVDDKISFVIDETRFAPLQRVRPKILFIVVGQTVWLMHVLNLLWISDFVTFVVMQTILGIALQVF